MNTLELNQAVEALGILGGTDGTEEILEQLRALKFMFDLIDKYSNKEILAALEAWAQAGEWAESWTQAGELARE